MEIKLDFNIKKRFGHSAAIVHKFIFSEFAKSHVYQDQDCWVRIKNDEIAKATGLSQSYLSRFTKLLVEEGYIVRQARDGGAYCYRPVIELNDIAAKQRKNEAKNAAMLAIEQL
jgi:DNA-binding MarR family transcriptional regulator